VLGVRAAHLRGGNLRDLIYTVEGEQTERRASAHRPAQARWGEGVRTFAPSGGSFWDGRQRLRTVTTYTFISLAIPSSPHSVCPPPPLATPHGPARAGPGAGRWSPVTLVLRSREGTELRLRRSVKGDGGGASEYRIDNAVKTWEEYDAALRSLRILPSAPPPDPPPPPLHGAPCLGPAVTHGPLSLVAK